MFFLFSVLSIAIILFGTIYFFIHFKNLSFVVFFNRYKWLPWVISGLMTLICIYLVHFIFDLSAAVILFLFYSFLIIDFLNLFFKKFIKAEFAFKIWTKLNRSGISAFVVTVIFITVSYFTAMNVVTTRYALQTNKSLGTSAMKISMISDVHLGTAVSIDKLKKYCDEIQASNPDFVVLTGDIFDENTPKGNMETACKLFGQIKSTYGVYYIFGNHEKGIHGIIPYFSTKDITSNLTLNKIIVLDDEIKLINNQFYIIGRKDASITGNASRKSLDELLKGVDKNKFILLLDHQPLDLEKASQNGIDLQLSGHTHGGQIWPVGLLLNVFNSKSLNYGNKSIGSYQVIVSSGIGTWNYPLRLGSKAEIVQILLKGQTP